MGMEECDFTADELAARLAGLRDLMAAADLDAVLITTDGNHRYFTGHVTHRWTHNYVALFALLPRQGEPVLLVPHFEAGMSQVDSWIETTRTFPVRHPLQGIEAITDAVREQGLESGRIGIEMGSMMWMRIPHDDFIQLRANLPGVEFADAAPLCWRLRARKSPAEVDLIRQAVAITDGAYEAVLDELRPGMSERELFSLLAVEHLKRGAEMPGSITICPNIPGSDRECDRTLRRPTDRTLVPGELITHDMGGRYRGYWSDYTRMFALGEVTAAQREVYRVTYESMHAAIAAVAPGRTTADLVEAAREVMRAAGHGDHAASLAGVGHASGIDIIEPPYLTHDPAIRIEEGMVLTVEPGLVADGDFYMLEEDVLVTAEGGEILSAPAPPELPVV